MADISLHLQFQGAAGRHLHRFRQRPAPVAPAQSRAPGARQARHPLPARPRPDRGHRPVRGQQALLAGLDLLFRSRGLIFTLPGPFPSPDTGRRSTPQPPCRPPAFSLPARRPLLEAARAARPTSSSRRSRATPCSAPRPATSPAPSRCSPQVVAARPNSGQALHLLGQARLKLGRFAEAREPLERAAKFLPKEVAAQINYAGCLTVLGEHEASLWALDRAAKLKPGDPVDHPQSRPRAGSTGPARGGRARL